MIEFDEHIFQMGGENNHQLVMFWGEKFLMFLMGMMISSIGEGKGVASEREGSVASKREQRVAPKRGAST